MRAKGDYIAIEVLGFDEIDIEKIYPNNVGYSGNKLICFVTLKNNSKHPWEWGKDDFEFDTAKGRTLLDVGISIMPEYLPNDWTVYPGKIPRNGKEKIWLILGEASKIERITALRYDKRVSSAWHESISIEQKHDLIEDRVREHLDIDITREEYYDLLDII